MVNLSAKDSSILTRITQYTTIPLKERQRLLSEASPEAKQIGEIILGTSTGEGAAADIRAAAKAYSEWLQNNRRASKVRSPRRRIARVK